MLHWVSALLASLDAFLNNLQPWEANCMVLGGLLLLCGLAWGGLDGIKHWRQKCLKQPRS